MNEQTDRWIEAALDDLATDERRTLAPVELEAVVLRLWDVRQAARRMRGFTRRRPVPVWQSAVAWTLVATIVLAVASLMRGPRSAPAQKAPAMAETDSIDVFPVPPVPIASEPAGATQVEARRPAANTRLRPTETAFVLVPEPFDLRTLHLVRVRMARTALITLGVPIVDPEAEGLVDVEMLVGDDGVARSIRNATFVTHTVDGGAER